MIFPKFLQIQILSIDKKPIIYADIIIGITLIAPRKNNYHLGPFFTNNKGIVTLSERDLLISVEAELETGLMDYCSYRECSKEVMIEVFDYKDLAKLIHGREAWGLVGKEALLYESKEKLLERIKACNNHLLDPVRVYSNFDGQDFLKVDLITELKK